MRRFWRCFALMLFVAPVLGLLTGCGDSRTALKSSHIQLGYEAVEYDGQYKEPSVTVKVGDALISSEEYDVTYSDNVEVGIATVTVTAKKESSLIRGKAQKTFEIEIHINEATAEDFGQVLESSTGRRKTWVHLNEDITGGGELRVQLADSANIIIDLDQKKIEKYFAIERAEAEGETITVTIKDGAIGSDSVAYGLALLGDNIHLVLERVKLMGSAAGLATNGRFAGCAVSASGCEFGGQAGAIGEVGVYLPASGTYEFSDCIFRGESAYFTKAGSHTLSNCTLVASGEKAAPEASENGFNVTGSALVVEGYEAHYGAAAIINIYGGTLASANNLSAEVYGAGAGHSGSSDGQVNIHLATLYAGATTAGGTVKYTEGSVSTHDCQKRAGAYSE